MEKAELVTDPLEDDNVFTQEHTSQRIVEQTGVEEHVDKR